MIEITEMNHVTLVVRNPKAARAFYGGVLGMDEAPIPRGFNAGTMWFRKGRAEVHLLHSSTSTQEPGDRPANPTERGDLGRARHVAFAVKDLDAAQERLAQHGVSVVLGPRPRGDGPIQLYCYDPDGHLVELHTLPDGG